MRSLAKMRVGNFILSLHIRDLGEFPYGQRTKSSLLMRKVSTLSHDLGFHPIQIVAKCFQPQLALCSMRIRVVWPGLLRNSL